MLAAAFAPCGYSFSSILSNREALMVPRCRPVSGCQAKPPRTNLSAEMKKAGTLPASR